MSTVKREWRERKSMCVRVSLWGERVWEDSEFVWKRKSMWVRRDKECMCYRETVCVRVCERETYCVGEIETMCESEWDCVCERDTVCEEKECVRREIECEWGERQSVCVWENLWAESVKDEYVSVRKTSVRERDCENVNMRRERVSRECKSWETVRGEVTVERLWEETMWEMR